MIQTVIFDMDGTLLDTLEDLAASVNHVLGTLGYPAVSLEKVRDSVGNGAGVLFEKVLPQGRENPLFAEAVQLHNTYYQAHCSLRTGPYEGITDLLQELKQENMGLAIVSNKGDGAVKELNRLYFNGLIPISVGERAGIRRKPNPDTVLEAMRQLQSTPENTVYVGDSEVDFETARRAGLPCILVSWGFRGRAALEELRNSETDPQRRDKTVIIDKPGEIMSYIRKM